MRILLVTTAILLATPIAAGGDRESDWYTIDAGSTMATSGGQWQLEGSVGQFDATQAGESSGGDLSLTGGFWALDSALLDELFCDRFEGMPVTFSNTLAETFRHPRCTTCHGVAATDFRRVNDTPPGVLPAAHPVVNATTDCTTCHTPALLPVEGTIAPGWQSAPAAFDFRDKTDAELCALASQPVSGHPPLEHMSEDKLVLWAVGDGRLPFNESVPTAPPNSIEQWRSRVQQWVDAGLPCP
jgi:hypothetical protein